MDWLSKLFDIKKIPTKFIVLVWLVATTLLILPEKTLINLSLQDFKDDYGKFIGIAFITSSGFLIILIITWIINKGTSERLKGKYKKTIKESILTLDEPEKAVLREFYIQGQRTLKMPADNPTVSSLINKRILYPVGNYGQPSLYGLLFNFSITTFAEKNLSGQLLGLPNTQPTAEEIQRIRALRPQWMLKLEENQRLFGI